MNDILLDDDFKSDKYSVSINELMFSRKYSPTVTSVSKLLDDNGYFGRYRIETVKDRKLGIHTLIKIHVYLVDSGVTYTWPFNTFFDLDTKRFGHNRKVPRGVFTEKFIFGYCVNVLSLICTPRSMLTDPLSTLECFCVLCSQKIKETNLPIDSWSWTICKTVSSFGQRPYYEKIIPFMTRIGMITDNKFRIIGRDDPKEFCDNLFDIDYWHNL